MAVGLLYTSPMILRRAVPGWQLPYLRIALILRRLERNERSDGPRSVLVGERAHIEQLQATITRDGWFN
jgi:hypothetical protein